VVTEGYRPDQVLLTRTEKGRADVYRTEAISDVTEPYNTVTQIDVEGGLMALPWPFPDESWFPWSAEQAEPQSDDLRLAALVAQRLSIDWTTRRQQINVTVQNGVVILAGTVADHEVRQVAGDLAWDVPGVLDVCNTLRPHGQRRSR
jgi:hypothetical protein